MEQNRNLDFNTDIKIGSNKSFGYIFTIVFSIIGIWPLIYGKDAIYIFLIFSFFTLIITIFFTKYLAPLNKIWFKFGLLLNKIVSPIILGFLYFFTFLPMGLLMRILGKDPLSLKKQADKVSYWVHRDPPGPSSKSFKNQF